jgi:hypothetical protein
VVNQRLFQAVPEKLEAIQMLDAYFPPRFAESGERAKAKS